MHKLSSMAQRSIKRIKLPQVKGYGDPVEVELPNGYEIHEGGYMEGLFNVWVSYNIEGDAEKAAFLMLEEGRDYDDDEFELVSMGVRPNGRAVSLLRKK